jgi:transcriptional antiterminator NusG
MTTVTDKQWYLVHTYSGHEDKVRSSIEKSAAIANLKDRIGDVVIPTEEVIELKKNKKQIRRRKFFPGYILVNMAADNETCYIIRTSRSRASRMRTDLQCTRKRSATLFAMHHSR